MDTLTKKVNGETVELSTEEVAEHEARKAEYEARALPNAKAAKCSEINTARDTKNSQPVLHVVDDVDKYFDVNILKWDNAALSMDDAQTIDWICEDNSTVQINKADILTLCNHIMTREAATYAAGRIQKDEVLSLTTVEEVEAYDVII